MSHFVTTFFRWLARHRFYAAVNLAGLAVGIAVFLVLALFVRFETSFERWIPGASQIYLVQRGWNLPGMPRGPGDNTMGATLDELRADYAQTRGTRLWPASVFVHLAGQVDEEPAAIVDPSFFSVFDLPLRAGDKATAFATPDRALITEGLARRYFGDKSALGRRLSLSVGSHTYDYIVAGVLEDPPANTDLLSFDIVVPFRADFFSTDVHWRDWGSGELLTYLRFSSSSAAAAFAKNFDSFVDRHALKDMGEQASRRLRLSLAPLTSLHLAKPADAVAVTALGLVGVLALLIAALNYVNLATAQAVLRSREVAVRKVAGASRVALNAQFLLEAVLSAGFAALAALALAELALPYINAAGGTSLKIDYADPLGPVGLALLTTLVVGLGAGLWPALTLSRQEPALTLASVRSPGAGRLGARVREALVLAQFAIAVGLCVVTGVLVAQTRHIAHADLGFRRDGLVLVSSFDDEGVTAEQRSALLAAWRAALGVAAVTESDAGPAKEDFNSWVDLQRQGAPSSTTNLGVTKVGPDFFQVYGAQLVAGRLFDPARVDDDLRLANDKSRANIVLNLAAVRALGFSSADEAIRGRIIHGGAEPFDIIGVVKDIRFRSPRLTVPPTLYVLTTADNPNAVAAIRYSSADPSFVRAELAAVWRRIAPGYPFDAQTADAALSAYARPEGQRAALFAIGAALAVGIGCTGLFGLASFSAASRTHEIGIRKTLGARSGDILRLLLYQFLRPVALANLVAWPLAYLAARLWLAGFDDRIALSPIYFIGASLVALLVAGAAIAGQCAQTARLDPADALRCD
jgi:putative ABC transport system permease protein